MIEAERIQRNQSRLQELYPYFRNRVQAVLQELEAARYRPRIQDAWRSPADQLKAYQQGTSRVQFGFHNVSGANGIKEALAADILDDDHISGTKTDYMLHLAAAAQRNGLTTGIRWGLSDPYSKAIDDAIAAQTWTVPIHVGWDPMHVEVTGITIPEAKHGLRPDTKDSGNSGGTPDPIPDAPKRKFKVEEIDANCIVEYSLGSTLRPVTLLPVPYVSQLGTGADAHANDCGAASAIMMMRAYQKSSMTPDEFYSQFNISGDPFLSVSQIQSAMNQMGLLTEFRTGLTIPDLFNLIASSKAVIVPIRYKVLFEAGLTEKSLEGPHFSVVVGLDPKNIYIHDPLYSDPMVGEAHVYPIDKFWQAWKEAAADPAFPNPERSAIIPKTGLGFQVSRNVKVNISSLNVRTGPGFNNPQVGTVKKGDTFAISHEINGWGEIGFSQWIKLSYTVDA